MTVIDGINSLRSEAEAKGKVDIYCQLPICTCHMKWLFCQSFFFLEKIFWITKKQYFKGIKSILTWWDRPLSQVIRKRTLKNVDIYITWHKALFYRHVQFELLYCTVKVMAYVIIFPQEQKEILTFQHVKYAITKQVGRNCIQFLQPHFHELAFQAP